MLERHRSALLCFFLSAACLAACFFFLKTSLPAESNASMLDAEDEGRIVAVAGKLVASSASSTGFWGRVCAASCIDFFVSGALAEKISSSRIDLDSLRSGATLRVEGIVRIDEKSAGAGANPRGVRIEVVYANGLELLS